MPPRTKLHYGWVVVAVTFTALLVSAGIRAAPGVLIVPLENEFHWSRATISFAVGVNILLTGLVGPFAAAARDRFGGRRTMALALALTAVGVALTPMMRQSWQLVLLWGVVVGTGCGVIGSFLAAYIPARWFRARQGLVFGLLMASNAAGQLIFLPTMASLVTHAGWRVMSLALAGTALAFVPLVAWLRRDRPANLRLAPYGAVSDRSLPSAPPAASNPMTIAFRALAVGARSRGREKICFGIRNSPSRHQNCCVVMMLRAQSEPARQRKFGVRQGNWQGNWQRNCSRGRMQVRRGI